MTSTQRTAPTGMAAFVVILAGQFVSLLGSGMTQFALTIWLFQETGQATPLALMGVFFMVPLLLMTPIVGVMVDRYDRKLMMMVSDLAAGVTTVGILILYLTGNLKVWHMYVNAVINGTFQGFQGLAYSAALSLLVDKKHYVRVQSMLEVVRPGSRIVSPILGGAIIGMGMAGGFDGLLVILLIDIVTFVVAVGSLLFVHIPSPERTDEGHEAEEGGFFRQALYGFRYMSERPPLLALQTVFLLGNFFFLMTAGVLFAPMLLARTGTNAWIFGASQTIGAIAMVVGGLVVGAWGGFKRRVHGVLLGWSFVFVGILITGFGRPDPPWMMGIWVVGIIISSMMVSLINGSNQAIWMSKVSPDVQGRVFAARRLVAWLANPLSALIAGPLADYVMEPAMLEGGSLTGTFGWMVGIGPGAGMSLIFVLMAICGLATSLGSYLVPIIRNVEDILPDHEGKVVTEEVESEEAVADAAPA